MFQDLMGFFLRLILSLKRFFFPIAHFLFQIQVFFFIFYYYCYSISKNCYWFSSVIFFF